jgi:hypothetical protein
MTIGNSLSPAIRPINLSSDPKASEHMPSVKFKRKMSILTLFNSLLKTLSPRFQSLNTDIDPRILSLSIEKSLKKYGFFKAFECLLGQPLLLE